MSPIDLDEKAFISAIMVGSCPECGSRNTHDCTYDDEEPHREFGECSFIKAIDDPLIGHCEECGAVFCIECSQIIGKWGEGSLSNGARGAEDHSKSCPEQKPKRWAQKYGTTHRLVSVQNDLVTITEHPEELPSHSAGHDEEDEGTITLRLSKRAEITPDELKKRIGDYMKFSYDMEEIYAVADLESDLA
jgi:hypothetical protein